VSHYLLSFYTFRKVCTFHRVNPATLPNWITRQSTSSISKGKIIKFHFIQCESKQKHIHA